MTKEKFTEIVENNNFEVVSLDESNYYLDFIIKDSYNVVKATGHVNKDTNRVCYNNIFGVICPSDMKKFINIVESCEGE